VERQGLLESHWREEEKRNKRFYRLSRHGEETLAQLLEDWDALTGAIDRIVERREIRK
jgi:PadR family transcriptional regulator PadR